MMIILHFFPEIKVFLFLCFISYNVEYVWLPILFRLIPMYNRVAVVNHNVFVVIVVMYLVCNFIDNYCVS